MRLNLNSKRLGRAGAALASAFVLVLLATAPVAGASAAPHQTTTSTTTATTTTTAPPSPPQITTSNFFCSGGVCAIGPGDVGIAFAAGLIGIGGPLYTGAECNPYLISIVSGGLPPGLQLGEPICEWEITGTPTTAGTYSFTVEIAPGFNNLAQSVGPDGFQQFTITLGTGSADRLQVFGATWSPRNTSLRSAASTSTTVPPTTFMWPPPAPYLRRSLREPPSTAATVASG